MTLKTSLIIGGDSSGGVEALDDLGTAMGKTGDAAKQAGDTVNAAMMKALEAIVENTGATSQHVAALITATTASRQRADAANSQAQAERAAAAAANDNARAEQLLAAQATALRAAIDPMYSAQQRFNQQLEVAESLLATNTINTVSKEAYGSTAAYAADRQLIQDIARDTIASANQQIAAAAAAASSSSSATSDATTAQLDEANDILTRIAAATGTTVSLLQSIATTGTTTNISALAALAATS